MSSKFESALRLIEDELCVLGLSKHDGSGDAILAHQLSPVFWVSLQTLVSELNLLFEVSSGDFSSDILAIWLVLDRKGDGITRRELRRSINSDQVDASSFNDALARLEELRLIRVEKEDRGRQRIYRA